jgi:hypothetical protein
MALSGFQKPLNTVQREIQSKNERFSLKKKADRSALPDLAHRFPPRNQDGNHRGVKVLCRATGVTTHSLQNMG